MSTLNVSIKVPVKSMHGSITIIGEIIDHRIRYIVEVGCGDLSQNQAEDIAKSILRCIRKTRSAYRKMHGRNAP